MTLRAPDRPPPAHVGGAVRPRAGMAVSAACHALVVAGLLTIPSGAPMPDPGATVAVELVMEDAPLPAEAAAEAASPQAAVDDPVMGQATEAIPEPAILAQPAEPPAPPEPPSPPVPPEPETPPVPAEPPSPPQPLAPPEPATPPTPPEPPVPPRPETPRAPPRPRAPPPPPSPRTVSRPAPSAAPDAAPAPPAQSVAEPTRINPSWNASIAAWLHRHKTYPPAARSRGEQGSAAVRFTVERDGSVTEVNLTRGSGSAILDDAVRALLTGAHVPAFPSDMTQARVTVTVQISYSLER